LWIIFQVIFFNGGNVADVLDSDLDDVVGLDGSDGDLDIVYLCNV